MKKILDDELAHSQVGDKGTFFIGVWSGFVASVIFSVINKFHSNSALQKISISETIPKFEPNKIIFVLPTEVAFKNCYITMDKNRII